MGAFLSTVEQKIFELKLRVKWSSDENEKLKAIDELASYGESVLQTLEDLSKVIVYEKVKTACVAAIKSIKEEGNQEEEEVQEEPKIVAHEGDHEVAPSEDAPNRTAEEVQEEPKIVAHEGDHEVAPLDELVNSLIERKKLLPSKSD